MYSIIHARNNFLSLIAPVSKNIDVYTCVPDTNFGNHLGKRVYNTNAFTYVGLIEDLLNERSMYSDQPLKNTPTSLYILVIDSVKQFKKVPLYAKHIYKQSVNNKVLFVLDNNFINSESFLDNTSLLN